MIDFVKEGEVINAFGDFDRKLESSKNLENRELDPQIEEYDIFTQSAEKFLDFYQVAKNIMIAKESYKAHVVPVHSRDVISMPREYWEEIVKYYLFKDGNFVTNSNEIKQIVKETTSIKLPRLSIESKFYPHKKEFVTNIESSKKYGRISPSEEQPNEKEIAEQIKSAQKEFNDLTTKFGFKNTNELLKNVKTLKKIIDTEDKKYRKYLKHNYVFFHTNQ